jgi:2-dehydropantoate 2-reductase
MKSQVHVVGAGGIGVVLAWSLAQAGWDVTLVERRSDKIASGQADGLVVAGQAPVNLPFVGFADWQPPADAIILLCTKTYDNPAVLARLKSTRGLVPVQNGYDALLDSRDFVGEGIASFVSECLRERPVARITRPGSLHIGARRPATAEERCELASLAEALKQAGLFKVELVEDVRPFKAAKLMYSAAISPLAAAAGVDNAELMTDTLAKRLFFGLLLENYAVLRHAGLTLAKIGPFHPDTVAQILRTPALPEFDGDLLPPVAARHLLLHGAGHRPGRDRDRRLQRPLGAPRRQLSLSDQPGGGPADHAHHPRRYDAGTQSSGRYGRRSREPGKSGMNLITGGAGFIGRHLVAALLGEGEEVRVLERPGTSVDHLLLDGIELVSADILADPPDAEILQSRIDAVIPFDRCARIGLIGTRR